MPEQRYQGERGRRRKYRGPVDPHEEFEKAAGMASTVRYFQSSGDSGVFSDDPLQGVRFEPCTVGDVQLPMFYWGAGEEQQRIYFQQAFLFHPDTARDLVSLATARSEIEPRRRGHIFVVDTGWIRGTPQAQGKAAHDIDPVPFSLPQPFDEHEVMAHEHGPAIVDVIERIGGPDVTVELRQIRFDQTQLPGIPMFEHPDRHPDNNKKMVVRGFSEDMLMATLDGLLDDLEDGSVVNLSLGAVACPTALSMGDERLYNWLVKATDRGAKVVAAAGNHGTTAPTWPAAYGTSLAQLATKVGPPGKGALANVFAVGSRPTGSTQHHDFSAHGWVTYWKDGLAVGFDSYQGKASSQGVVDASWTGTSFAAPQKAVELLPAIQPTDGSRPDLSVGEGAPIPVGRSGDDEVAEELDLRGRRPVEVDLTSAGVSGRLKAMAGKLGWFRRPR